MPMPPVDRIALSWAAAFCYICVFGDPYARLVAGAIGPIITLGALYLIRSEISRAAIRQRASSLARLLRQLKAAPASKLPPGDAPPSDSEAAR